MQDPARRKADMSTSTTITVTSRPETRAWDDFEHRDRYFHAVSDDEHAADLLCEAFPDMDQRHPYALCGVSLVVFPGDPEFLHFLDPYSAEKCPECAALE